MTMTDFDAMLAADAGAFSDAFANATITYTPRIGEPVQRRAIVDWKPPPPRGQYPQAKPVNVRIDVENNAATGISATDPELIGGTIAWPEFHGAAKLKTAGIERGNIASIDGGRIVFEF